MVALADSPAGARKQLAVIGSEAAVADAIDSSPSRTANRSRDEACEHSDRCGVRIRSLRSLLSRQ